MEDKAADFLTDTSNGEELEQWAGRLVTLFCKQYNMQRKDFEDLDAQASVFLLETLQKVKNNDTAKSFVFKSVLGLLLNYVCKEIDKYQTECHSDVEAVKEDCLAFDWDSMPEEHKTVYEVIFELNEELPHGRDSPCQIRKHARKILRAEYGWSHSKIRRVFNELKEEYGA